MLQIIRDRMSGPLVWGIIGFLVLLFAVWGIGAQSFLGGGSAPTLAKVGSTEITQTQFQNAFNRSYERLVQMAGNNFDPSQINLSELREDVFNGLVRNAVIDQYAIRKGYKVSNRELYEFLKTIPAFQSNGSFSADTYRKVLSRNGLAPTIYEGHLRNALRSEQLQSAVMGTSFVVPKQTAMNWVILRQQRDFESVIFDPITYRPKIHPRANAIKAYYEKHKAHYFEPEAIKLSYLELSQRDLSPANRPRKAVLKAIYDQQKNDRFHIAAERKASQILIRYGSDSQAAQRKIERIAKRIGQGESFSALAKKYSQDPISSTKGGVVGWIKQGSDNSTFEKAVFSLKKIGQVSSPIKTSTGWHLIRLDQIRPEHTLPFKSPIVQHALIKTYDSRVAAKRFHNDQKKLSELTYEHPGSLDPAAKALGLHIKSTSWITRDKGSGIAKHHDVLAAAFSKDVLQNGNNSKPVAVGPGDLVVIRKSSLKPKKQLTLSEVTGRIREKLIDNDSVKEAEKSAHSLMKAVQHGVPFKKACKTDNLTLSEHEAVTRNDAKLPSALVETAFRLPKPAKGQSSVGLSRLPGEKFAVIVLTAVHDASLKSADVKDPKYAALGNRLNSNLENLEFDNYWNFMATQIGIQVKKTPGSMSAPVPG